MRGKAPRGLTLQFAIRARLKSRREASLRQLVGDAESMVDGELGYRAGWKGVEEV